MSANGSTFHPFGRLPIELRDQIWETAVIDLQPRICSWEQTIQNKFRSGSLDWEDSASLVVLDSPSLRYVCQESRRVALKHSATAGWTVPGTTHPYRRYDAHRDILYMDMDTLEVVPRLDMTLGSQNCGEAGDSNASTAMRIRQTRHIAIPWTLLRLQDELSWDMISYEELTLSFPHMLMQTFPQLEEITVAISQVDVADIIASRTRWSNWQVPQRPCKLATFARFEPTMQEQPEIPTIDNAYRGGPLRSVYLRFARISGSFERAADIIASATGTQRVPAPRIAQVYQLSQETDADYKWEELPDRR